MKIALVDVDNWGKLQNCFPNIPLMKLSAHHKNAGNTVEWYDPNKHYDIVYISKVFSFTKEPYKSYNADKVIRGGSGYAILLKNGHEYYHKENDVCLEECIEHIYPDYSIYNITDTAYGFMSRGCPRGCNFCHVKDKEGLRSVKVANLSEFYNGQKNINLCDPNTFACKDWENILQQLSDSNANIDFNQGVDIRLMNEEKISALLKCKTKSIHFAWDRYQDKEIITRNLQLFKEMTGWKRNKVSVYILTNFDTTLEQDIERAEFCKSLDFNPYIMRYDKEHIKRGSRINALARYCNNKMIFWKCKSFEQYEKDKLKGLWR